MIKRRQADTWTDTTVDIYKDEPGTWMQVTKQVLFESDQSSFQTRYFEIAPGGYSSHEKHEHEHCVLVLKGEGEVLLGEEWHKVGLQDVVHVRPMQPHQFVNKGTEPFGILCIVDKDRDRPIGVNQ